jgi:hypothetical protein
MIRTDFPLVVNLTEAHVRSAAAYYGCDVTENETSVSFCLFVEALGETLTYRSFK